MGRLSASVAARAGLPVEETCVGFKALAERLRAGGVVAAAEESGGYTWKGNLPERDGLLTALLFIEMLSKTRLALSSLVRRLSDEHGPSHYLRLDLPLLAPVPDKAAASAALRARLPARLLGLKVAAVSGLDGLKLTMEDGSWLLIRPSGTEPLVRIYSETRSRRSTSALAALAVKAVRREGLA
jgi:phosphomannomutase